MLRGLWWFSLAAIVATAALVGPSAALASCDGSGSAVSIYTECVPSAKGGSHTHGGRKPSTPTSQSGGASSSGYIAPPVVHVSPVTKHALKHSGADKKALTNIATNPNLVDAQRLKPVLASSPTGASSLDSAFDLGAGPMILFALLVGTVLVLLGVGGVRTWRNRHRV